MPDNDRTFNLIENYIYLYHIDKFVLLPTWPEQIQDNLSSTFASTQPLARSAPIMSYSYSGPRTIQVSLNLHREMMSQINYANSNLDLEIGDDYVDTMIKQLQAVALPRYQASVKMVNPPMVALRFGNEIYVKGVVNGGVSVQYSGPIIQMKVGNDYVDKYALVAISFTITEVDPYDADSVQTYGSFRGLNKTLERRLYK